MLKILHNNSCFPEMGMMWATFYARISEADDWLAATLLAKPHHNAGDETGGIRVNDQR
jgi:hypothetical protein